MTRSRRHLAIRRRHLCIATVVGLGLLAAGCHPLTNPADPSSTAFTGERTSKDPEEPPRVLPEVIRWRIESANSGGQMIGFDIPADGSFIEPRAPVNTPHFVIVATFAETPSEGSFDGGLYVWAVATTSGTMTAPVSFDASGFDATTNSIRLRIDTAPPEARARIKFVDRNSHVAGDVSFSFLAGDVNGDGTVDNTDLGLPDGVEAYDGMFADEGVPATVRADVNASGVVEGAGVGDPDYDASQFFAGNDLTGLAFPEL